MRISNVQATWLVGTVTTVLFVGIFVPLTLQRSAEDLDYRKGLANETIARVIHAHQVTIADEAAAQRLGIQTHTVASGGRDVDVLLRPGSPVGSHLGTLGAALDPATTTHLPRTMVVPQATGGGAFLAQPAPTGTRVVEIDVRAMTTSLDRLLGDFWQECAFALNGHDVVVVNRGAHPVGLLQVAAEASQETSYPLLGDLKTDYHEHRPFLPIETILVLILATSGMFATWIGTRIVARLDVLNESTKSQLDETEQKLSIAQEISQQAQKLDAVGKLTGGVAHDFNNLLSVVLANAELAKDVAANPRVLEHLDEVLDATRRGADLTKSMLAFARRARLEPKILDLNRIVRDAQGWMTRTLPESISVEVSLLAGLWPVSVDQTALETALLNLLLNAKDAMGGKGKLTIETANVRIDLEYTVERREDLEPGRYVMLAVSDDGHGIRPEDLPFVFDPFYTTKKVGQGTGLGLSMVQGFVKQSGGTIRVYSEVGQGTTFKLYFPASADRATPDPIVAEGTHVAPPEGRLLLVEDEDSVRTVLATVLRNAGFTVIEAVNGDEGLRLYGDGRDVDLVITDIVMPGELQGPGLASAIRARNPAARFVFMSGYANEAQVHGNNLRPEDVRLMKPIARDVLVACVRDVLQKR